MNGIELKTQEINLLAAESVSMKKELKRIYNRERKNLLINSIWENWIATCKGMKLDQEEFCVYYAQKSTQMDKGLNRRTKTIKLLEDNI